MTIFTGSHAPFIHRFSFRIGRREPPYCDQAPSDPLGELSTIDLAIRRFCHYDNRSVSIAIDDIEMKVGEREASFQLDPDVSSQFFDLIQSFRDLRQRRPFSIVFAEKWWRMYCTDLSQDQVHLTLESFGLSISTVSVTCSHGQLCECYQDFLITLLCMAQEDGYLDASQYNEMRLFLEAV